MSDQPFQTYRAFWRFYVAEHAQLWTRRLHFIGTSGALALLIAAPFYGLWLIPLAFVFAYGSAWVGHFFVEGNKPATFRYPLWSLIADFHMYGLMWAGRMGAEADRLAGSGAGVSDLLGPTDERSATDHRAPKPKESR